MHASTAIQSTQAALEVALSETMAEIDKCAQLKDSLENRLTIVRAKADVNASRLSVRSGGNNVSLDSFFRSNLHHFANNLHFSPTLQVRNNRPGREKTMDDVECVLLKQQGFVGGFDDKVQRAMRHLDREISQLDMVRQRLEADMYDKLEAIDVDSKVLGIFPDGTVGDAGTLQRRAEGKLKTPHTWLQSSDENIKLSRQWITDSTRLRKAVKTAILSSRMAEHQLSRDLNARMMSKLSQTRGLKEHLERELERVQVETARAEQQRSNLAHALESKRGPLLQAKERFAARKARPERELVQDEVEAALAKEIMHLNSVTAQLSFKLGAVDKEINSLGLAAETIEANIRDKAAALSLDEQMAMMDGRLNLNTAPPSSVASAASSGLSAAREATLRRINDLEHDLMTARREREVLEANVLHLKETLSPKGHLE